MAKKTQINQKNQQQILRQRRRINVGLLAVVCGLGFWVAQLFQQEIQHSVALLDSRRQIDHIEIIRSTGGLANVVLNQTPDGWQLTKPYQNAASQAVIEALLTRLVSGCRVLSDSSLSMSPKMYATLITNVNRYEIGEVNPAADLVYVRQLDDKYDSHDPAKQTANTAAAKLMLCDKLLASIALAPAINFVDKRLYAGELQRVESINGSLNEVNGLDLSVLQLAPADKAHIAKERLIPLTFISNVGQISYQVLPVTADAQHILLYSEEKQLIYGIAMQEKLATILGL